jgi:hypothetical protein
MPRKPAMQGMSEGCPARARNRSFSCPVSVAISVGRSAMIAIPRPDDYEPLQLYGGTRRSSLTPSRMTRGVRRSRATPACQRGRSPSIPEKSRRDRSTCGRSRRRGRTATSARTTRTTEWSERSSCSRHLDPCGKMPPRCRPDQPRFARTFSPSAANVTSPPLPVAWCLASG